jgi:hypothetical protein
VRGELRPKSSEERDNAMADKTESATWTDAEASGQWGTEVESETQIVLEAEGDGFTAHFTGMDPRNASGIIQAHFEKGYSLNGEYLGDSLFLNATRDLERKLAKVPNGRETRIKWVGSLDTGQPTPMRVFSVQYR